MKMRLVKAASIIIAVLTLSPPSVAAIRPSFGVDSAGWYATDVVEVAATESGGQFAVLETWKGDLRPGERVPVPELRPDADSVAPRACEFGVSGNENDYYCSNKIPRQIDGSHMVLFLTPTSKPTNAGGESSASRIWQAPFWRSSDAESLKASTVWIEGERTYCFRQVINPGNSVLVDCGTNETKLKERVLVVVDAQQRLARIAELQDRKLRAESLRQFLLSNLHLDKAERVFEANYFALKELGKCGQPGVPVVRTMLDDPEFSSYTNALLEEFALAEGDSVTIGKELTARLKRELQFWRRVAPTLSKDWLNPNTAITNPDLHRHHLDTIFLVEKLGSTHYAEAMTTLVELRNYWSSQPQLNNNHDDPMVAECDETIRHLQGK